MVVRELKRSRVDNHSSSSNNSDSNNNNIDDYDDDILSSLSAYDSLVNSLPSNVRSIFLNATIRHCNDRLSTISSEATDDMIESDHNIETIIAYIKTCLPSVSAEAPDESFQYPSFGAFQGYTCQNTIHVDSFLYSDNDVDDLVDAGKLSRNLCLNCQRRDNIIPLNYISHSFSVDELKFVFKSLLPNLENKVVVDVGSRLGAVLIAGYYYSNAKTLIGIEISSFFYELQAKLINVFQLSSKCRVIHGDMKDYIDTLLTADVVILHNVFDFFCDKTIATTYWLLLSQKLTKKDVYMITVPSLHDSWINLGLPCDILTNWVTEETVVYPSSLDEPGARLYEDIHLYRIK